MFTPRRPESRYRPLVRSQRGRSLVATLTVAAALCAVVTVAGSPSPACAQKITYDRATWEASKDAPTSFTVADAKMTAVWGKAQDVITSINDRNVCTMRIRQVTPNLIETDEPDALGRIGYRITSTKAAAGYLIKVDTIAYEQNMFSKSSEHKEAAKRARLVSYLLQRYRDSLPDAPSVPSAPAGAMRPDVEALLSSIRTLVAANQIGAALVAVEALKTLLQTASAPVQTKPAAQTGADSASVGADVTSAR